MTRLQPVRDFESEEVIGQRASGVLCAISSLPSQAPIGDLGPMARVFVDFLSQARQSYWQLLPVCPIGKGNSPYSSPSSSAGEFLLISLEDIAKERLIKRSDVPLGGSGEKASYAAVRRIKKKILKEAYQNRANASSEFLEDFDRFQEDGAYWLEDYCLFSSLASHLKTCEWDLWPKPLRDRDPSAMAEIKIKLKEEIHLHRFVQFLFQRQFHHLKAYARAQGIQLIGDIPIFVPHPSVDVWAHPKDFLLDRNKRMKAVAGCPPDDFCKEGQSWGNALYDWQAQRQNNYLFWEKRLRRMMELFDVIRLDHFIGFHRYWEIPVDAPTAASGSWKPGPGAHFFKTLKKNLGSLPFIAEDLGAVTDEVWALRDEFSFPGMRVMQFGYDEPLGASYHQPHTFPENCVVYPGTHDNDTIMGWHESLLKDDSPEGRQKAMLIKGALAKTSRGARDVMLRLAFSSPANLCMVSIQDVLGLDGRARMNKPGTAKGNWEYRVLKQQLTGKVALELSQLTQAYRRIKTAP